GQSPRHHGGGEDGKERSQVCGGGVLTGAQRDRCSLRHEPWHPAESQGETQGYAVEGDPAGLGVKTAGGDRGEARIPDQDEGRDADGVQQPHRENARREHEKRLRKNQSHAVVKTRISPTPSRPEHWGAIRTSKRGAPMIRVVGSEVTPERKN